jgi:hypothetical protein
MRTALLAALALASLAAPAAADGLYFTEGGGATHFKNQISNYVTDGGHAHVALGYRGKSNAVEVWIGGDMSENDQPSLTTFGLDFKRAFPITKHVQTYLRGSMSRMSVDDYGGGPLHNYAGRGLGFGAGLQVQGRAPLLAMLYPPIALVCLIPNACKKLGPEGTIALWVDEGYDFYRLHGPGHSVDVEATRWTIGIALGSDF